MAVRYRKAKKSNPTVLTLVNPGKPRAKKVAAKRKAKPKRAPTRKPVKRKANSPRMTAKKRKAPTKRKAPVKRKTTTTRKKATTVKRKTTTAKRKTTTKQKTTARKRKLPPKPDRKPPMTTPGGLKVAGLRNRKVKGRRAAGWEWINTVNSPRYPETMGYWRGWENPMAVRKRKKRKTIRKRKTARKASVKRRVMSPKRRTVAKKRKPVRRKRYANKKRVVRKRTTRKRPVRRKGRVANPKRRRRVTKKQKVSKRSKYRNPDTVTELLKKGALVAGGFFAGRLMANVISRYAGSMLPAAVQQHISVVGNVAALAAALVLPKYVKALQKHKHALALGAAAALVIDLADKYMPTVMVPWFGPSGGAVASAELGEYIYSPLGEYISEGGPVTEALAEYVDEPLGATSAELDAGVVGGGSLYGSPEDIELLDDIQLLDGAPMQDPVMGAPMEVMDIPFDPALAPRGVDYGLAFSRAGNAGGIFNK